MERQTDKDGVGRGGEREKYKRQTDRHRKRAKGWDPLP